METISKGLRSSQDVFGAGSKNSRPKMALIRDLCGISAMATLALYSLCAREPNIFPSMQTLAKNMKVSPSTAKRAVRELQRAGYLRVTHRTHQTNLFTITVTSDPSERSPMTLHQFTQEPPEQVTSDPLSGSPMTPPQVTHDPPPRSPVTPKEASEVYKIRSKRESKRTLSPAIHSQKETLTCPKCEHTWPKDFGPVCHTCRMDIGTIARRIKEGKRIGKRREISFEERVAELEAIQREMDTQKQARKQRKATPPVQKPQAEEPTKEALEEADVGIQEARKELFDIVGKPYDAKLQEHLAHGKDGGRP